MAPYLDPDAPDTAQRREDYLEAWLSGELCDDDLTAPLVSMVEDEPEWVCWWLVAHRSGDEADREQAAGDLKRALERYIAAQAGEVV